MSQNETANSTVHLNGEQAKQELTALAQKAQNLRARLVEANEAGDGKAFEKLNKELIQTNKQMKQLAKEAFDVKKVLDNLSGASMPDLTKAKKELDKQLSSPAIKRNSTEWKELQSQLKAVKTEMSSISNESKVTESAFTKLANFTNKTWQMFAAGAAALLGVVLGLKSAAMEAARMSDVYGQVQKYTGESAAGVAVLNEEIKKMDTRTARDELNRLLGEAGKLGVKGKEDLLQFAKAADIIQVSLGEDLGADAVKNIGKLTYMFGVQGEMGMEKSILAVGSAINQVGQNSTASEAYLLEFTNRLSGMGVAANMTIPQIIGFASVLDQNAQQVEMSSTAMNKFISTLATDSASIAKAIGIPAAKLKKAVGEDMNAALLMVFEQLNKKGGLIDLAPLFSDLGAEGARAASVITILASKFKDVGTEQALAQKSFTEGTSVIKEFNVQNNTMQAKVDKSKKAFLDASEALGLALSPAFLQSTNAAVYMVKGLALMPKWLKENRGLILTLAITMGIYAIAVNRVRIATLAQLALEKIKIMWTAASTAATLAQVAVTGYLTGATRAANLATKAFFVTLGLNPFIAIGIAIAAITIGLYKLVTANKEVSQSTQSHIDIQKKSQEEYQKQAAEIDILVAKIHNENLSNADRKKAIEDLKAIIPGYNGMLNAEGKLINDNKIAIDQYLVSLEKQIKMKAAQEEWEELIRKKRKVDQEVEKERIKNESTKERNKVDVVYGGEAGIAGAVSKMDIVRRSQDKYNESLKRQTEIQSAILLLEKEIKSATPKSTNSGPKEGDISADGLQIYKNGKWVNINSGGGGGGTTPDSKETPYEKDLKLKEQFFKDEEALNKKAYADETIGEEVFHEWMYNAKMDFLKEKLALDKKYKKDTTATEIEIADLIISENEYWNNKIKEEAEKLLKEEKKNNKESEKETKDHLKAIEDIRREFGLEGLRSTYSQQLDLLKTKLAEEKATEEETAQAIADFKRKTAENYAQDSVDVTQRLSNAMGNIIEAEQIAVENKYAAEFKAAEGNADATSALQEKVEEEKKQIKKKYADLDFAITAAKIIAETGAAIMKAAPNVPLQIAEGLLGASQLVLANQQREQIQNLWTGGFTDPGDKYKPAGIVHAGEFVANQDAVRSAPMRKVFNLIDHAQKTNTVARITNDDIARVVGVRKGFADGGYTTSGQAAASGGGSGITKEELAWAIGIAMEGNNAVNSALLAEIQKGIKAKVSASGKDGVVEAVDQYNVIIKNARR